jgi:hypothetical protein
VGAGKGSRPTTGSSSPLTLLQHREHHLWGKATWERKYSTHEMHLKLFSKSIGFEPGEFMIVGMEPKRRVEEGFVSDRLKFQ